MGCFKLPWNLAGGSGAPLGAATVRLKLSLFGPLPRRSRDQEIPNQFKLLHISVWELLGRLRKKQNPSRPKIPEKSQTAANGFLGFVWDCWRFLSVLSNVIEADRNVLGDCLRCFGAFAVLVDARSRARIDKRKIPDKSQTRTNGRLRFVWDFWRLRSKF